MCELCSYFTTVSESVCVPAGALGRDDHDPILANEKLLIGNLTQGHLLHDIQRVFSGHKVLLKMSSTFSLTAPIMPQLAL